MASVIAIVVLYGVILAGMAPALVRWNVERGIFRDDSEVE